MTASALPTVERARRYLAAMPPAVSGERGHDATFAAAGAMVHGFALDENTAYALLAAEFNPRCQPPWPADKLARKVRQALASASTKPRGYLLGNLIDAPHSSMPCAAPKWPEVDEQKREQIIADGPDAAELCERSPLVFEENDGSNIPDILEQLFSTVAVPDPLLCIGKSNAVFATRPLSHWIASGKLANSSLIVPSPMTARTGKTKEGKVSEHTLENTGPRRFLVVEFDQGAFDDHAALIWHLAGFAPLALVVHSGGKSLHGWFYCHEEPEESLRRFMVYAVSLGADKATWTRSQFVRLPAGQRENGARQNVFYFNPAPISYASQPSHE